MWLCPILALLAIAGFVAMSAESGVAGTARGIEAAAHNIDSHSLQLKYLVGPIGFALAVFGVLFGLSWRQGRLSPAAIVAIATLFTGFVDPLANWATFAVLNPDIPHFPLSWLWFKLAPLIEPVSAFLGGYSAYYMLVGLGTYRLSKACLHSPLAPRWTRKHPASALFLCAYAVSIPFNLLLQLAWMENGVLVYTQCAGPILHVGRHQYPLLIALYDPFVYATIATLCLPCEQGRSRVLAAMAKRLTREDWSTGTPSAREIVIAIALVWTSILVPISFFAGARVMGLATQPAYNQFPFPSAKIYDPYGDLERAGRPGPFYR